MDLASVISLSQHARLLQLQGPAVGDLIVERFEGTESICDDGFRFEIDCFSTSAFIEPADLIAQRLSLTLSQADGTPRYWHGHCTQVAPLGSDGGLARYRLTMEPWTAFLRLRRNALIFQNRDVLGVLEAVFADHPVAAFRFDVTQPLRTPAITTQYREHDWAFVTRLLADHGLAWRFEHEQADEGASPKGTSFGAHTLVIFDREAGLPAMSPDTLRFHRIDSTERSDAVTVFTERRQATADTFATASWQCETVEAHAATLDGEPAGPHLPRREHYTVPRAGVFARRSDADQIAELRLDALRLPQRLHHGVGNERGLTVGAVFTLTQHADLSGQRFVPLAIEHVATNNLDSGILDLLDHADQQSGTYRNRFVCVPQGTAIVPLPRPKPTAPGCQTALVVGLPDAANTSNRDHQVRIQFAWQRGSQPHRGGLTDTGGNGEGHAPGNDTTGTWVRVSEWLAGPNWGSVALPRIGSEVLVEFLHGDIDRPIVTGQLYNGDVAPPFALAEASNHPGTLSGLHTQSLDGGGTQQWVIDDAPGQLRTRLHTSLADSGLELGYLIAHNNASRGSLRGQGFDLATLGWGNLRAEQGVLLSTSARDRASSTQMDVADAVGQLKGAQRTAQALSDAAEGNQVAPLAANPQQTDFITKVDVAQQGKYEGSVSGQSATKPQRNQRDGGDPVEKFADPKLLMEGPDSIALTTPKSALSYSGGNFHLTSQSDTHLAAGHTFAGVSGGHVAFFAQKGLFKAVAEQGPLSVQAHAGKLEVLADQSVTITATDERIDVLAKDKMVLQADQSTITLEGGNITIACRGEFKVKAGEKPFRGGANNPAALDTLPDGVTDHVIELLYTYHNLAPVQGASFKLVFANGETIGGKLDDQGKARVENPPGHAVKVEYGEDRRSTPVPFIEPLANPIAGAAPSTDEEARQLLEQYAAAERAYLEDHFFDDEIEEMESQEWSAFEHDAYQDYRLDGEEVAAGGDYRAEHPEQTADKESAA